MTEKTAVAKALARAVGLGPDVHVVVDLDSELGPAFTSLASSAGAEISVPEGADPVADPAALGDAGAAAVQIWEGPLVPVGVRRVIESVKPGGAVAVYIAHPPADMSAELLAERMRPVLDLSKSHAQRLTAGGLVLSGVRRPALTSSKRKELRGLAHGIEASVMIGRAGLTPALVQATRDALERHGIVKAKLTPQSDLDKTAAAVDLAWATGAKLVQRVGKVAVLWRPDVTLEPPVSKNPRKR